MTVRPDRRRLALVVTLALALLSLATVVVVGDRPRWRTDGFGDPAGRAAVAFRDREIPFFQWGTELYMVPLLEGAYAEVAYLTQRQPSDLLRLVEVVEEQLRRHETVDLFLAVHGGRTLPGLFGRIDPDLRSRLRLVYSTGCGDAWFGERWLELGADAFVGHDGEMSMSPIFLVYFLRRWSEGHPVADAVALANEQAAHRLAVAQALSPPGFDLVRQTHARALGDLQRGIGR